MRMSSTLLFVVTLISITSLLAIWFYPSVQDFMASNNMWNGIDEFSNEFNAEQINSLKDLPDLPEKVVLIAIPYLEYTDEELSSMKRFVNDGGTLLLMDDYGYGNIILEYIGVSVRFTNEPLLDPLFSYKNQSMPRITDFASDVKDSGIDVIMLNHATTLTNTTESKIIAWSSGSSFLDTNENGSWDQGEQKGPFTIATEFRLGQGTLILVSDPSVVINTMVDRDDNYAFTRHITDRESEQKEVLVDYSHLTKTPLDVSKMRLLGAREMLSNPYGLLVITAMIFVVVSRYTLKKGEIVG
ncbi:DUF4350 domain-containing protein [Chloroflexota bacterium]